MLLLVEIGFIQYACDVMLGFVRRDVEDDMSTMLDGLTISWAMCCFL